MQCAPAESRRPNPRVMVSTPDNAQGAGRALRAVYASGDTALPSDLQALLNRLH